MNENENNFFVFAHLPFEHSILSKEQNVKEQMVNEQKNKMSSTPHGHRPCPEVRVNRVGCVCALTRSSRARVSPTHQHCWPFRASHIRGHTHTNPCLRAPSAAFSCGYPSVSYQHVFLFGPHRPNHVSSTCPGSAPSVTLQSSCSVFVSGCPPHDVGDPQNYRPWTYFVVV